MSAVAAVLSGDRDAIVSAVRRNRAVAFAGAAIVLGTVATQYQEIVRAVLGAGALVAFALLVRTNRSLALGGVVVWLVMLGFFRRLLIPFAGWNPQDPLLLVSPACAVILWHDGTKRDAPRRSLLGSLALILLLFAVAQVFNPSEPSIVVGAQAALFWLTPLFWFFAGRTLTEDDHRVVLDTVFWIGIVVTAHGLYQTFFRLLPFEYTWLDYGGPGEAIFLEGFRIRPFSTLVSPQEYGFFLSILAMVIVARLLHGRRHPVTFAYLGAVVLALFLQGTRQVLLLFVVGTLVLVILRVRSVGARIIAVALVAFAVALLVPAALRPKPGLDPALESAAAPTGTTASLLAQHQVEGLTNPMDSTAPLHIKLIADGFSASLSNPFGVGIGKTSIAASKAGRQNVNTENDVAAVFAGLGPVGGLLFVAFILAALGAAMRTYHRRPGVMHLAWAGILIVHLTQWWSGTLYATTSILFCSIGGIAVARLPERRKRITEA